MTTEEKAKRYDEALEQARKWYNNQNSSSIGKSYLYAVFPELKESEDERIRKALIKFHKSTIDIDGIKGDDVLAWLEKQGEPMEINPTEFDTRLQTLIGKFDNLPKEDLIGSLSFWMNVVQNDGTYKNEEKQGEQKPIIKMKTPEESLCIDSETYNKIVDECVYGEQKPTDETPYPKTLEKAIDLYYYSYGNGKGEFEHLSLEKFRDIVHTFVSDYGQKPTWSEEDNKWIESLIQTFEDGYFEGFNQLKSYGVIDWLKSLKDKVQPKQEWSEEDEEMLKSVMATCKLAKQDRDSSPAKHLLEMQLHWLKIIKQRMEG